MILKPPVVRSSFILVLRRGMYNNINCKHLDTDFMTVGMFTYIFICRQFVRNITTA